MSRIQLEQATDEHIELVYQWQCHPLTRRHSNNTNIPSWNEHYKWMKNKLSCSDDFFYMAKCKDSNDYCGVLRLDMQSQGVYVISIFLKPDTYGKGVGKDILELVDKLHPNIDINAVVLKKNIVSQKLFERAGYRKISEELYMKKRKNERIC